MLLWRSPKFCKEHVRGHILCRVSLDGLYPWSTKTRELLGNLEVRGKSWGWRGWISQFLPSFGGVRTFSHHQSFYREWIRKSFPVNREGLTVLKSILPCWWWEKCCTLSLCYLDAETRWWSSQKPKYQYRDNLVGQLTTSRASCDTQKQEWFCIFHLQQNYLHNHDNDDDLGH